MAPTVQALLDHMKKRNAIALFATESIEDAGKSHITQELTKIMKTQIYLPDSRVSETYRKVFGLSQDECNLLSSLRRDRRQFLLKHHVDSVVGELNLGGMNFELSVLSATVDSLALLENVIQEVGDNPGRWLPLFEERIA